MTIDLVLEINLTLLNMMDCSEKRRVGEEKLKAYYKRQYE